MTWPLLLCIAVIRPGCRIVPLGSSPDHAVVLFCSCHPDHPTPPYTLRLRLVTDPRRLGFEREPGWKALPLDLRCEVLIRVFRSHTYGSLGSSTKIPWERHPLVGTDPKILRTTRCFGLLSSNPYPTFDDWARHYPATQVRDGEDYDPWMMVFCPNDQLPGDVSQAVKNVRRSRRRLWENTMRLLHYVGSHNLPDGPLGDCSQWASSMPLGVNLKCQPYANWRALLRRSRAQR